MNKIPQAILDKHKEGVEIVRFYGVPVTALDRDGLLACIGLLSKSLYSSQTDVVKVLGMVEALRKARRD